MRPRFLAVAALALALVPLAAFAQEKPDALELYRSGNFQAAIDICRRELEELPREMERMGITPGSRVRVTTRRGSLVLKARADRDIAEGMVFIPFAFAEAPANMLTNPQLDPYGKIPEFKFCAAKVELAKAAAEAAE